MRCSPPREHAGLAAQSGVPPLPPRVSSESRFRPHDMLLYTAALISMHRRGGSRGRQAGRQARAAGGMKGQIRAVGEGCYQERAGGPLGVHSAYRMRHRRAERKRAAQGCSQVGARRRAALAPESALGGARTGRRRQQRSGPQAQRAPHLRRRRACSRSVPGSFCLRRVRQLCMRMPCTGGCSRTAGVHRRLGALEAALRRVKAGGAGGGGGGTGTQRRRRPARQ